MLNSFPQTAGNADLTMQTYEAVLADVTPQAVIEAAQRFTTGAVHGQNRTFAPSVAEFVHEARRIASVLPHRGKKALPAPSRLLRGEPGPDERARMCLKLPLLQAAIRNGRADLLAEAERNGLAQLVALAERWQVPVSEKIWSQVRGAR